MHERSGLVLLALVATGCPPTTPAPVTTVAPVVEEPPPTPVSTAIPDLGYAVSTPRLVRAPARVRVAPLARSALSVRWADRHTYLVLRGWGGLVKTPNHRAVSLPRRHYVHTSFSPGRRYLALTDDRRRLLVLSLPRGKVLHDVASAEAPKWIADGVVAFRRGCAALSLDMNTPRATPRTIGAVPAPCRSIIEVSDDYATWTIADRGALRDGRWQIHTALRVADLRAGAVRTLRSTPFMAPRISPSGKRQCWLEPNFDLHCQLDQAPSEKIWSNVRRPIRFDDTGKRLLFAVGDKRDPGSRVYVVDFGARAIAALPRAGREWWVFLAGGSRIAGHGGTSSGLLYDLASGWSAEVGDAGSEWEGMWPVPGDPNRLAVGRERRGSRDLFQAVISR